MTRQSLFMPYCLPTEILSTHRSHALRPRLYMLLMSAKIKGKQRSSDCETKESTTELGRCLSLQLEYPSGAPAVLGNIWLTACETLGFLMPFLLFLFNTSPNTTFPAGWKTLIASHSSWLQSPAHLISQSETTLPGKQRARC